MRPIRLGMPSFRFRHPGGKSRKSGRRSATAGVCAPMPPSSNPAPSVTFDTARTSVRKQPFTDEGTVGVLELEVQKSHITATL